MTPELLIDLFQQSLFVGVKIIIFIILPGLIVGLFVSIIQAATQINEQTLSFLPRLVVTLLVMVFGAPWLFKVMIDFTNRLIVEIPLLIG